MKSIYILLTKTNTILSKAIHAAPGNQYTHSALSLDDSFTRLYSFGRKYKYSYLPAGFVQESVNTGLLGDSDDVECAVYELKISNRKYKKLCKILDEMEAEVELYQYNILGLILCLFGVENQRRHYFFCSQFVSYVLMKSGVMEFGKAPSLIRPADFQTMPEANQIFCGKVGQLRQQPMHNR